MRKNKKGGNLKKPLGWVSLVVLFFNQSAITWAGYRPPELLPVPAQTFAPDPLLEKMWHLHKSGTVNAWKSTQGIRQTTIAIVDSGIDYNHPDLSPNIARNESEFPTNGMDKDGNGFNDDAIGWDFVRGFWLPFDKGGHGTFMASLIASRKDNGEGGAGVCPRCSLMGLRFINSEGLGDTEDAIRAIYYAANAGVSVLNMSFGGEGYDRDLAKALEFAGSKNVVVVVSACNDGEDLDKASTYPAKFQMPHMMTIGASTREDELMDGSNWGNKTVALLAPGEEVLGIWKGVYETGSGTSHAAAVASGVVGLVRSANPNLPNDKVVQIIRKTVRKIPGHQKISQTSGIIDAESAVGCALDPNQGCLR